MVRKRGALLIALSLVLGVGAALVANNWIQQRTAPADPGKSYAVVAAMEIPFGTKVEPRHVRSIEMMPGSAPPGTFTDPAQVVGRVSTGNVYPGELLVAPRFVTHETGSPLSAMVEKNMRAVTVRVDDVVGVAGFLLPGNRVDIVAARKQSDRAEADTILRFVKVLAVDQTAATDKNEPVIVRAVTLEVTPEQAEILVKHKEQGSIQLTLRNPLDTDGSEPVKVAEAAPPKPVVIRVPVARRAEPRPPAVTVIRGTQVKDQAAAL